MIERTLSRSRQAAASTEKFLGRLEQKYAQRQADEVRAKSIDENATDSIRYVNMAFERSREFGKLLTERAERRFQARRLEEDRYFASNLMRRTHNDTEKSSSRFSKIKTPAIFGNIAIGAAELLTSGGNASALMADAIHNGADAAAYATQFEADEQRDAEKVRRLRKIGHWVMASGSAVVGSKAVYDLASGGEHIAPTVSVLAASASVAFNGYLGRHFLPKIREKGWRNLTHTEKDIAKHFVLVDAPSSALAFGGAVAAQMGAHQASATAAIVSGAIGAWVFRPTAKNLADEHVCASHAHSHHDCKAHAVPS